MILKIMSQLVVHWSNIVIQKNAAIHMCDAIDSILPERYWDTIVSLGGC